MDRVTVQFGANPLDTDLLNSNRYPMIGLGVALQAILGAGPNVDGLPCVPGTGLAVNIGPGSIYISAPIDETAYGSLPADTTDQIVQQGITFGETPLSVPAPMTAGQSISYLVEAQFQQIDSDPVQLLYYNSDAPLQPLLGTATNTKRGGVCALQVKAGTPATTGTQATPTPDAGWTGLYVVTVPYGAASITQGEIALYPGAPFISTKLGGFMQTCAGNPNGFVAGNAGVSGLSAPSLVWDTADSTIWICTTSGNAAAAAWSRNSLMRVYAGNPNGFVAGTAGTPGGASPSMIWDTVNAILWVCTASGTAATSVWAEIGSSTAWPFWCGTSTGTANAQVISTPTAMQSFGVGTSVSWKVGAGLSNTSAVTLAIGSFGTVALRKDGPAGPIALAGGELIAGNIASGRYDGTYLHLTATEMGTAALANASSNTGTVAAVIGAGALTPGHILVAGDASGSVQDSGISLATLNATLITVANNGQVVQPGTYFADTTGGAFSVLLATTVAGVYTFVDPSNYWAANNFTVNGNGTSIGNVPTNVAATFLADVSDQQFSIKAASTYWRLV